VNVVNVQITHLLDFHLGIYLFRKSEHDETMECVQIMFYLNTISEVGNRVRVMVFNATFNNISVISWRSVLLLEESGVPGENHRPSASH